MFSHSWKWVGQENCSLLASFWSLAAIVKMKANGTMKNTVVKAIPKMPISQRVGLRMAITALSPFCSSTERAGR